MSRDDSWTARVGYGLVTALLTLGFGLLSLFLTFGSAYGTCDGDGGDPFSARASAAGRFCESGWSDVYFSVELGAPILTMLVLGSWAAARREGHLIVVGLVVSLILALVLAAVPQALPDRCDDSADQYSEDCQTY